AIGDSDFCISGYQVWDQEQNKRRTIKPVSGSFTLTEMGKNIFRYESVLRGVAWKLVRRSVVTEHKLFFPPEVRYAEDTLFYFKYLSCIETFVVIRDAQYVYRKHNQESLVKTSYQEITLIEAFFKELEKLYIEAPQINLRNLIACWQVLNLWEFGRCACYRTRGFQKRKRLFYEIVRRYDIKRKCRQVRCISVPCSAVRLTVLSNTFLPFNLFIRAAGRVMQWDKQFV
ncbi:MAG: hypothetical protein IJ088_13050, partial [Clostridia bacterium]|nr:hypothetical protein [Clostridia bacterium]